MLHVKNRYCEDTGEMVGKTTHLPAGFTAEEREQYVVSINPVCLEYKIKDEEEMVTSGFGAVEGDFAWMREEEATVECLLSDNSGYTLSVIQGCGIPFGELKREMNLEVYFNGNLAGSYVLGENTENGRFDIEIPQEWMLAGKNEVTLRVPNMWSPSEYGAPDDRLLGFALKELLFEKD